MRSHGVHGAVKVQPETDDVLRYKGLKSVYIETGNTYSLLEVQDLHFLNEGVILKFEGVDSVEEAQKLKGLFICVDRQHAVTLPEYHYFITDLIGCEIFDESNKRIGCITDVLPGVANDVIIVDNGRISVPFIKKLLISVQTEESKIVFRSDILTEVAMYAD